MPLLNGSKRTIKISKKSAIIFILKNGGCAKRHAVMFNVSYSFVKITFNAFSRSACEKVSYALIISHSLK